MLTMAHANPMEVEKSLKGIDFPAKKEDLVKLAVSFRAIPHESDDL